MAAPVLQFKRGLLSNLPALRAGEPGFTTDTFDLYVGLSSEVSANKFFGSHRYWIKESSSTGSGINVVEGTSNGSSYITLKSPDSLAGIVTYTLPGTDGSTNQVLATNGSGTLSFIDAVASLNVAGDSGTDNINLLTETLSIVGTASEIETEVSNNQVQIGLPDNVVVGASLTVSNSLTVTGVSTFNSDIDLTGNLDVIGDIAATQSITALDLRTETFSASGISTFTGVIDANGGADISGGETILSSATVSDLIDNRIVVAGTSGSLEDSGNLTFDGSTLTVVGYADLDDVNVSSAATIATAVITSATITNTVFGTGTAISGVDTDLNLVSVSDDTLASAKAIKDYVDAQVTAQDLDFAGDTGTGAVDLDSQTFTIAGTTNEIVTSASGQTITIALPDNVVVGASLTVTSALDVDGGASINNVQVGVTDGNEIDTSTGNLTIDSAGGTVTIDDELVVSGDVRINGNDIKASDGSTNITLTSNTLTEVKGDLQVTGNDIRDSGGSAALTFDGSQNVTANANLTVSGNLYVSGNTTQVNTASMTVEDRTIELGVVDGSTPASATTWDLGVLFNYNSSGAKKSGVVWEQSTSRFIFGSQLTDGGGTDADSPQISFSAYAPIEISALWLNDCAGQSQVISCTGSERFLENITIDAGTF